MAYRVKAYTLREESTESGTRYFISFKDGQGKSHELEVSEQFFMEFRQMERRNRNLLQWDERHREFNEVWDETLYRRALRVPKSLDERMVEEERNETLYKAVGSLPEIQRRRFLLYYEYATAMRRRCLMAFGKRATGSLSPLPTKRHRSTAALPGSPAVSFGRTEA